MRLTRRGGGRSGPLARSAVGGGSSGPAARAAAPGRPIGRAFRAGWPGRQRLGAGIAWELPPVSPAPSDANPVRPTWRKADVSAPAAAPRGPALARPRLARGPRELVPGAYREPVVADVHPIGRARPARCPRACSRPSSRRRASGARQTLLAALPSGARRQNTPRRLPVGARPTNAAVLVGRGGEPTRRSRRRTAGDSSPTACSGNRVRGARAGARPTTPRRRSAGAQQTHLAVLPRRGPTNPRATDPVRLASKDRTTRSTQGTQGPDPGRRDGSPNRPHERGHDASTDPIEVPRQAGGELLKRRRLRSSRCVTKGGCVAGLRQPPWQTRRARRRSGGRLLARSSCARPDRGHRACP